jgi:phosphonate transport system ATP-binding protein
MIRNIIEIKKLRVISQANCILAIDHLTISEGEHVALIGANGAGKSTLLKVIGGLISPSSGQLRVLDSSFAAPAAGKLSAKQWRALRARVGQVMQGLHLVSRLSALENVVLGALARRDVMPTWRSWIRRYPQPLIEQAEELLRELSLYEQRHTRADQLSGGERQKVALARLWLQKPELVLADEPTSALDPTATTQACDFLRRIPSLIASVTVVHDASLIPLVANRVLGLSNGHVVLDCPSSALTPSDLSKLYASDGEPVKGPNPETFGQNDVSVQPFLPLDIKCKT